jgi:hypothetical protein
MEEIDNIDYFVPSLGDTAVNSVVRIEALFKTARTLLFRAHLLSDNRLALWNDGRYSLKS